MKRKKRDELGRYLGDAKRVRSLLKKGYIKRAGIPSFVEITGSGEKYFVETM